MKEQFPLYRHKRLYCSNERFQKYKYVDFKTYQQFEKLKNTIDNLTNKAQEEGSYEEQYDQDDNRLLGDRGECYAEAESDMPITTKHPGRWNEWYNYNEARYYKLRECGYFYNNLKYIRNILDSCTSLSEFKLKLAVYGIDEKYSAYVCCYMLITPSKYLKYDWSSFDKNTKSKILRGSNTLSTYQLEDFFKWSILHEYYQEIIENNIDICSYKEFIQQRF